jgi:hypothetical protein
VPAQRHCVCEPTTQRTCKICGESFEIERKPGRPRDYCLTCSPPGYQVVRVAAWPEWRTRPAWWKLRRRPPGFSWAVLRGGGGDAAAE